MADRVEAKCVGEEEMGLIGWSGCWLGLRLSGEEPAGRDYYLWLRQASRAKLNETFENAFLVCAPCQAHTPSINSAKHTSRVRNSTNLHAWPGKCSLTTTYLFTSACKTYVAVSQKRATCAWAL